jgi:two-component system, OmpR family, KDP operon response regulator KdpE
MTRVLVVDDEPQILRALRINLRVRHYDVQTAATGTGALEQAAKHPPDLVILDLGLPDLDGVEVIQGLRGWTTAPIIVLSGRSDSIDKVEALDAGADDYITKPFGMEELLARMRAVGRRATADGDEPRVRLGDLVVDLAAKRVIREPAASAPATAGGQDQADKDQADKDQADQDQADQDQAAQDQAAQDQAAPDQAGQEQAGQDQADQEQAGHGGADIRLTPTEWHLLEVLLRHPGKLLSQQQLLSEVWGPGYADATGNLRLYMAQLRRKLEPDPARPRWLLTEPGMGYRYQPGADSAA